MGIHHHNRTWFWMQTSQQSAFVNRVDRNMEIEMGSRTEKGSFLDIMMAVWE